MNNKITKPKTCMVENDEFFYRHPEMFRAKLDETITEYIETQKEEK